MKAPTISDAEQEFHRKTASGCFNHAWEYLEKKDRSGGDEEEMLHLAHASRFHWGLVGNARNRAVGDWQISRVYAALNQPGLSLQFAKSSLEICRKNDLQEVMGSAFEAIARAYAVAGDYSPARNYIEKAREQVSKLSLDDEDRETYMGQIRETEALMVPEKHVSRKK